MVSGFGADLSFWVWSRSNVIISASSNPTKSFHTTNPNSTKTMPSNPTVSTSSATPSNDAVLTNNYLVVVVVVINRRESLASSHHSLSRRLSSFFQRNPLFPSFSPHQERSTICSSLVCLWAPVCGGEEDGVSSGNGPTLESERFYPWTVKREREFEINLWWDYLKERIWSIWIFGGGPSRLVFLRLSQSKKKKKIILKDKATIVFKADKVKEK